LGWVRQCLPGVGVVIAVDRQKQCFAPKMGLFFDKRVLWVRVKDGDTLNFAHFTRSVALVFSGAEGL
jgi:hypothetical protein